MKKRTRNIGAMPDRKLCRNALLDVRQTASSTIVRGLEKKKLDEIFAERSQGFWIEEEIREDLQKITIRAKRLKTERISCRKSSEVLQSHSSMKRKSTKKNYTSLQKQNVVRESYNNKQNTVLPFLKQFIKNQEYVKTIENIQNEQYRLVRNKRRKIIHLIIFSLHRYRVGRTLEALELLLIASMHFERRDHESELKQICLGFIYKMEKEIQENNRQSSQIFRKRKKVVKRRRTLTVMKYISQQKFMENFFEEFRKSKLIHESTFYAFSKGAKNAGRVNAKCNVHIPPPQTIFPELNPAPTNYKYVAVVANDMTNSFPYAYPKSLINMISEREYRQFFCKLNSLLYPQSKTYTFERIVKMYYIPFLLIFFVMMLFTIVSTSTKRQSLSVRIFYMVGFFIILAILGMTMNSQKNGYTNMVEIKQKMNSYLSQFQKEFQHKNVKFRMAEQADAIFIIFQASEDCYSSSNSDLSLIEQEANEHTDSKDVSLENRTIFMQEQTENQESLKDIDEQQTPAKTPNTPNKKSNFYQGQGTPKNNLTPLRHEVEANSSIVLKKINKVKRKAQAESEKLHSSGDEAEESPNSQRSICTTEEEEEQENRRGEDRKYIQFYFPPSNAQAAQKQQEEE